mmetsp:Transcript_107586/g.278479  ORF Transcript_107586/g.278479 Transcript_107586/m.278479 type:complete len:188 (-) Transcript_107586:56-619(-)
MLLPRIELREYSRHPRNFLDVMLHGDHLRDARQQMDAVGVSPLQEPHRFMIFVEPPLVHWVLRAIAHHSLELRPSHVIVSEAHAPALDATLSSLRSRENVRLLQSRDISTALREWLSWSSMRDEIRLDWPPRRGDRLLPSSPYVVRNTMVHLPEAALEPIVTSVTASTTDATIGPNRNPRRALTPTA